jgi:hypothetical protein
MAAQDSNADGKLSAADENFGELKLWVDANSNGITDAGELHGLVDFGVVEINLDFAKGTELNNGNLLGMTSSYTSADGSQHEVADVWFAQQAAQPALSTEDLLAAPAAELPGGTGAAAAAAVTAAAAVPMGHTGLVGHSTTDDDLLRQQNLLI